MAIDESAPLKAGEMESDTPDGPMRTTMDMKAGAGSVDMGAKGKMKFSFDRPAPGAAPDMSAMAFHIDGKQMTMAGFVETLGQFSNQIGGGTGRQIVDMTGLKGLYTFTIDLSGLGFNGNPPQDTSAPSVFTTVQDNLGLRLEAQKAPIDVLVIDHAEKVPTAN